MRRVRVDVVRRESGGDPPTTGIGCTTNDATPTTTPTATDRAHTAHDDEREWQTGGARDVTSNCDAWQSARMPVVAVAVLVVAVGLSNADAVAPSGERIAPVVTGEPNSDDRAAA